MNKGTVVLLGAVGLGAGAGAYYLLDPKEGARRRRRLRDKAIVIGYEARRQGRKAMKTARSAGEVINGLLANRYVRRVNGKEGLAERVQAAVAKLPSRPGVTAKVRQGKVVLSGPILAEEAGELVAKVAAMRGVSEVVDKLEPTWPEPAHEGRHSFESSTGNGLTGHAWSTNGRVMASAGGTLGLLGLGLLTRGLIARRA
jgi:hypothetical protein